MPEATGKQVRHSHSRRKSRVGVWRRLILITVTVGFAATAGFGTLPANPLSDGLRGFVSENIPALVLQPFNAVLQDLAVPTLAGQTEAAPEAGIEANNMPVQPEPATTTVEVAASSTSTATLTPTGTFTPSATVTFTVTPTVSITPTGQRCFTLTAPANGTVLPNQGNVLFSWSAMPGTAKYEIIFTAPDKTWSKYTLSSTKYTFAIGTLASGGTYTWTVSAYDAAGKLLCTALEFKFKKDVSSTPTPTWTPTETPTLPGTLFPTVSPFPTWFPTDTPISLSCASGSLVAISQYSPTDAVQADWDGISWTITTIANWGSGRCNLMVNNNGASAITVTFRLATNICSPSTIPGGGFGASLGGNDSAGECPVELYVP